jgi:hypothetical protein
MMMEKVLLNDEPFLQGGPFLELCVVIKAAGRPELLEYVLTKLPMLPFPSFVNLDDARRGSTPFLDGWIVDNELNTWMYEATIPLVVNISGWRKCQLRVAELCHGLYQLDFEFFGDRDDAPEWHQLGVREIDDPVFRECLGKICSIFNADLGLIGVEADATTFFCLLFQDPGFIKAYERLLSAHVASNRDIEALGFQSGHFGAVFLKGRLFLRPF